MTIDIQTVLASLTGSAVIAGAVGYVLKKSFDRSLELRIANLKEERKAEIEERKRRDAELFDQQRDAFKTVLSLAYRSRNSAKAIIQQFDNNEPESTRQHLDRDSDWMSYRTYSKSMIQLLYDERAIMPPRLFAVAHEMKTLLVTFELVAEHLRHVGTHETEGKEKGHRERYLRDLRNYYEQINTMYDVITEEVQARLEVKD
jgi:hypothetical protein